MRALETSGAAFFRNGVPFTEAWLRCEWLEMRKAIGTREISQIQDHVRYWFQVGERLGTETSPAERRDIVSRKLAEAIAALEADDAWRHQRAQAASEKVDVASADVAAYLEAAAAVAKASNKAAARAERDALEEAAVNAYPDLFPVVEARRPVSKFSSHVVFG